MVSVVVFLVPFAFIVLTAVKDRQQASLLDFSWPHQFQFVQNFVDVVQARDYMLIIAFINSTILTVASVAPDGGAGGDGRLRAAAPAAAGGTGFINFLVLAGLIIPPAVVPTIWVLQKLGLFRTMPGLILVEVAFGLSFCILLFRAFIATIPRELDEAAIIDGAGPLRLFFRVIFPLLRPVIITVVVVQSVAVFNDFVNPLYFLPGDQNATVQLTLYNFSEPVQHPVQPALHEHPADHHPAADHVPVLQPPDRGRHDRRRGQGLKSLADEQIALVGSSRVQLPGRVSRLTSDEAGRRPAVRGSSAGS